MMSPQHKKKHGFELDYFMPLKLKNRTVKKPKMKKIKTFGSRRNIFESNPRKVQNSHQRHMSQNNISKAKYQEGIKKMVRAKNSSLNSGNSLKECGLPGFPHLKVGKIKSSKRSLNLNGNVFASLHDLAKKKKNHHELWNWKMKYKIKWEGSEWPEIKKLFHFVKGIGEGSFAQVYQAFEIKTKNQVAIKVIDKRKIKGRKRRKLVEKELYYLSNLDDHPNIIRLENMVEDKKRVNPKLKGDRFI